MASLSTFFLLLAFSMVFATIRSNDGKNESSDVKGEDELIPDLQPNYLRLLEERPVIVQSRASRIDCILNLRSFELCRNLLQ